MPENATPETAHDDPAAIDDDLDTGGPGQLGDLGDGGR